MKIEGLCHNVMILSHLKVISVGPDRTVSGSSLVTSLVARHLFFSLKTKHKTSAQLLRELPECVRCNRLEEEPVTLDSVLVPPSGLCV